GCGAGGWVLAGVGVGSVAYLLIGKTSSYGWFLIGALLAGLSQSVYHPADYAILAARIGEGRVGRAFSMHTFAGYLGSALAPPLMLGLAMLAGAGPAIAAAGLLGLAVAAAGGPTPRPHAPPPP